MIPAIPPAIPTPAFVPYKYQNVFYVDSVGGSDTNNGSYEKPFKTLTKVNSVTTNSGCLWLLAPGTYSDAITITALNLDICGFGSRSGLSNISGTINVSNASSSIRFRDLSHAALTISGAGDVYLLTCNSLGGAISKTGTGYLNVESCDWGSATSISISAGIALLKNTVNSFLTNSGSGNTFVNSCTNCVYPNVTGGFLDISDTTIIGTTVGAVAVRSSSTGGISLNNVEVADPTGALAKVSFQGSNYSMRGVNYLESGSTITATNIGLVGTYDKLKMIAPSAASTSSATVDAAGMDENGNLVRTAATAVPVEALVKRTTTQTYSAGGDNVISFNSKDYDTHNAYNTSTYSFTCPRDGFITIIITLQTPQTTINLFNIAKNGVYFANGVRTSSGSDIQTAIFKTKCARGDVFVPRIYVASTVTGTSEGLSNWASFSIV